MFDDTPAAPQGAAPQNLPLGEPEDVFAQTEASDMAPPTPSLEGTASPLPMNTDSTSALDAGILRPKESLPMQPMIAPQPPIAPLPSADMGYAQDMNTVKDPSLSRGILVIIIVVVAVLLLGGAGWWVYRYLNVPQVAPVSDLSDTVDESLTPSDDGSNTEEDLSVSEEVTSSPEPTEELLPDDATSSTTQPVDENLLFGDVSDTDADGLDDKREEGLGTDPEKLDTDGDELSDGDEVIIWGTNPLNPDTDGDSFLDGKEVKAGFSPKGSGKLFEVKSSTSSSTTNP